MKRFQISSQASIKDHFLSSYKRLYERPGNEELILHADKLLENLPHLSQIHIEILSQPFSEEEIKDLVFNSKPLKSQGPDCIHPSFLYQRKQLTI